MLIDFFLNVKNSGINVTLKELLDLVNALDKRIINPKIEDFYYLSRSIMIKDEKYYDRFDRAFSIFFEGVENLDVDFLKDEIPEEWLRKQFEKTLTKEERKKIESLDDLEELMKKFMETFNEQKNRHQGGGKWIGTGGTSPYGAYGSNPFGIRIGQDGNRNFSAAKVWDKRKYMNLDDDVEVGTRNIKVALKKLRKFKRINGNDELDIDETIKKTANNGGYVDIRLKPERKNQVKVLLFFDVGGSMDPYIKLCEELFSAAKYEFKNMEYFYFHNFIYEGVWNNNDRREEVVEIKDIVNKYGSDYKIIFVGDASMGIYEITHINGSIEHYNEKPGESYFYQIKNHFDRVAWLNPIPKEEWEYSQSISYTKHLIENKMFNFTIDGVNQAVKYLSK